MGYSRTAGQSLPGDAMSLNLRQIRDERKLTQDDVAAMTGISKSFLSQIETGARKPSMETLELLATALHVTAGDLLQPQGFAEPPAPETAAHRILKGLDPLPPKALPEPDLKLGTDGRFVQIIATVDRDGLDKLIKQLEAMRIFLDA